MKTIASKYVAGQLLELVALGYGKWIVTCNGQVSDARRKLGAEEAREWYDQASRQEGPRP